MIDMDGEIDDATAKELVALSLSDFRPRAIATRTPCPACATEQVEFIGAVHEAEGPTAHWRCRHCKHKWNVVFQ